MTVWDEAFDGLATIYRRYGDRVQVATIRRLSDGVRLEAMLTGCVELRATVRGGGSESYVVRVGGIDQRNTGNLWLDLDRAVAMTAAKA